MLQELSRRKQILCIVTLSRDLNLNVNSHFHLAEAKTSSMQRRRQTSSSMQMSKSSHNTCNHYIMFLINYHLLRARCHSNGQGWLQHMYWPWLLHKAHLSESCPAIRRLLCLLLNRLQLPIGKKPTISKQVPLSMTQIHTLTHYLPYMSSYVLETYSSR